MTVYDTFLKQPTEVLLTDGRKIKHFYDGSGKLLKTVYFDAQNTVIETWEFVGNLIFKNGVPYQLATPEGRAVYNNTTAQWEYEFEYKDHLGNTRVSFKAQNGQLIKTAETAFDPWGLKLTGVGSVNTFQNRWELQGHESEETFGLNRVNFGARTYNPTIGRWDRVDNFSELMPNLSGYRYSFNNPINVTDPDGNFEDFEYSDGYSMNSTANGTVGRTSFSGTYQTGKQDGCPPDCGGDPSTPYNGNTTGTTNVTDLQFKPWKSRLRNESEKAAVTGVDIAGAVEAPLLLWKGGLKLFSTLKRMITGFDDAARSSSKILNTTTKQLQAKFKHAADFGVTGNWNKSAASRFNSAINQHINSTAVETIQGTYRGQQVIHSLNPKTGLNVISSPSGKFISGWKLNPAQLQNVLKHGKL